MFEKINRVEISRNILARTFEFLQRHGHDGNESHAIWVGSEKNNVFVISDVWFPAQTNYPIFYEVSEDEEFRINVELNKKLLTTISQIHTHPGSAFHSETDDDWPSVVLPGSLSVVIPDFGFIEIDDIDSWEVYQYDGENWRHVPKTEVKKLFQIIQ
jgi:hypothetical protein